MPLMDSLLHHSNASQSVSFARTQMLNVRDVNNFASANLDIETTPDCSGPLDQSEEKCKKLSKSELKKQNYLKRKECRRIKRKEVKDRRKKRLQCAKENGEVLGLTRRQVLSKCVPMADSDCKTNIVLDCSFNDLMSSKDVCKLAHQIAHCYSINRRSAKPVQFSVTSLGPDNHTPDYGFEHLSSEENSLEFQLRSIDYKNWDMQFHKEHFLDLFPKEKIVYLCAESEVPLPDGIAEMNKSDSQFSNDKVYVIGGLVDHNHKKGHCYELATNNQFQTAQLPLKQNSICLNTRKVLSIVHVFDAISKVVAGLETWKESLERVMPRRKLNLSDGTISNEIINTKTD